MKKYISIFSFVMLSLVFLTGCEEDTVTYNPNSSKGIASFSADNSNILVTSSGSEESAIVVNVSNLKNVDREIGYEISVSSTATPNQYIIDAGSLVVPAGSHTGTIKITGVYDELNEGLQTLVLKLTSVGDNPDIMAISQFDNIHKLGITKQIDLD